MNRVINNPGIGYLPIIIFVIIPVLSGCQQAKSVEERPNIIIMLADDAGYADFGFMGSEDLKTPNLDKLAEAGMVFTDAHVTASVCGPSRAGLITGRYQQRFGFECNPPAEFSGLPVDEKTIATLLAEAGYATAAFGKWHLGEDPEDRPNQRGFDYSWCFLSGGRSYFPNSSGDKEGHIQSIRENDHFTTFEGYLTDVLSEKAVSFIDRNKDRPFFMYWAPNAVHTPMQATVEDLARFEGHPRQTLAAMTWALDRAVGNIIGKLEEEKLLGNTLIFFLSDNGGAHNNQSSNLPLKGFKGNKYEGGHRVAFFAHWPDMIKEGERFGGLTSSLDIFATAADAAGASIPKERPLDGISLTPFFTGEQIDNPHDKLFWRKGGMAAYRREDFKLIRVDSLGHRLYNLVNDVGETKNLVDSSEQRLRSMHVDLESWEQELMEPLWLESKQWNQVTWLIHQDLFNNEKVGIKNPSQLKDVMND